MTTEEMIEFLEDKDNAALLLCAYQHPGTIMRTIAAKLRAAEELADHIARDIPTDAWGEYLQMLAKKYRKAGGGE